MAKGCYAQKIPFPAYLRRKFMFYMSKFEMSTYESSPLHNGDDWYSLELLKTSDNPQTLL